MGVNLLKINSLFDDQYLIREVLGQGGNGVVYRARELRVFEREVALKRVHPGHADGDSEHDQDLLDLFKKEARLLTRVSHPGVMRLFKYDEDPDCVPYLVSELIRGRIMTLPVVTSKMQPLAFFEAVSGFLEEMDQLLEIIGCCHEEGILHCDLKPENVMLQQTFGYGDLVRVLDFGISRVLTGGVAPKLGPGHIQMTLDFAAPEQLLNGDLTAGTDIYAMGQILSQGLSGRLDHDASLDDKPGVQIEKVKKARTRQPTQRPGPPVHPDLAAVVEIALRLNPGERYKTAGEFRTSLRAAANTLADRVHQPHLFPPPRVAVPALPDAELLDQVARITANFRSSAPSGDQPWAGSCIVVLPGDGPAGRECMASYKEDLLPRLTGFLGDDGPMPLVLLAEQLTPANIGCDEVEALEYARFIFWEVSGLSDQVSILLQHHINLGNVVPILLDSQKAPLAFLHAGTLAYGGNLAADEQRDQRMADTAGALLMCRWRALAMEKQWADREMSTPYLLMAYRSLMLGDEPAAISALEGLVQSAPENPLFHYRLATLAMHRARDSAAWLGLIEVLDQVTLEVPEHASAWRQLGIALDKVGNTERALECLKMATRLAPGDHDAWSSLGGVYKRKVKALEQDVMSCRGEALDCYEEGSRVSGGHPYPLLNLIRMKAADQGHLKLDRELYNQLDDVVAERGRQAVARMDEPWCHLDRAEGLLYLGQGDQALHALRVGAVNKAYSPWALQSFLDSMRALERGQVELSGLQELRAYAETLAGERPE